MKIGQHNVIHKPVVDRRKIIFPPLHIKLGLMKQYVKALDKEGDCFDQICSEFPGLTDEKLKAGVFDGPQIRKLVNDDKFEGTMDNIELAAWKLFVQVVKNLLGNTRDYNYKELVNTMLKCFQEQDINMSIKVHYLHSHLCGFPDNCSDFSDEQGE